MALVANTPRAATAVDAEVVVKSRFRGNGVWEIVLSNNYSARLNVQLSGGTIGTLTGDFRFYDTEVGSKEQVADFLKLPNTLRSPSALLHPSNYEIAVRIPGTNKFHEVSVWFNRDTLPSEELRLFFEMWRNVWSGVPGHPRAPEGYAR